MPVAQVGGETRGRVTADLVEGRASSRKTRRRSKKSAAATAALVAASPSPNPMQRLFDTSREVFSGSAPGFVPPPDAVARLAAILSTHLFPSLPPLNHARVFINQTKPTHEPMAPDSVRPRLLSNLRFPEQNREI
jgi:hypothetical protein